MTSRATISSAVLLRLATSKRCGTSAAGAAIFPASRHRIATNTFCGPRRLRGGASSSASGRLRTCWTMPARILSAHLMARRSRKPYSRHARLSVVPSNPPSFPPVQLGASGSLEIVGARWADPTRRTSTGSIASTRRASNNGGERQPSERSACVPAPFFVMRCGRRRRATRSLLLSLCLWGPSSDGCPPLRSGHSVADYLTVSADDGPGGHRRVL